MSPAATHTVADATAAILDAADQLFYERGVSAVSVTDIRDRAGVSLRRLYSLFPGKTDVVSGWLRHRHIRWMQDFSRQIESGLDQGVSPVDAVFDALRNWLVATDFRGCGFINTLAETGEITALHRDLIRDHKQSVVQLLDGLPGLKGYGRPLAVLVDGAIVQASIFATTDPVAAARTAAVALAEGHKEDS